jgi:hypothetical protein
MTGFVFGVIVVATVVAWVKLDELPDFIAPVVFVAVLVEGFALLVGGVALAVNHAEMPGQLAQIEQLRTDVRRVDVAESEDVIGQVVQWNQHIRSQQRYNDVWWAAWSIPNRWDSVLPIELPMRGDS